MTRTEAHWGYEHAEELHVVKGYSLPMARRYMDMSIPREHKRAMQSAGISNPRPREFWAGYNRYMMDFA